MLMVETKQSFKKYFKTRTIMLRTSFADKVEILLEKDLDEVSSLSDFWPI